jgi:hypothetical protein
VCVLVMVSAGAGNHGDGGRSAPIELSRAEAAGYRAEKPAGVWGILWGVSTDIAITQ